jgi:hypothetical protein
MDNLPNEILAHIFQYNYVPYEYCISKRFNSISKLVHIQRLKTLDDLYPDWRNHPEFYLYRISEDGDIDLLLFILHYKNSLYYLYYNPIAIGAAKGGHINILKFGIKRGATS